MAGPKIYYTYDRNTYLVRGVFSTAALATTAAAGDSDLVANIAGLNEAQDAAGNTVDAMLVEPGIDWYHFSEAPYLRQQYRDLHPVRTGVQQFHERMHELSAIERLVGPDYPEITGLIVRYTLYGLHQGMYLVNHRAALTPAQIGQILRTSAQGPNDVKGGSPAYDPNNPRTIVPLIDAWREPLTDEVAIQRANRPHVVPRIYANITANPLVVSIARRSFADMMNEDMLLAGESAPTPAQLREGRWINAINR